MKRLACSVVFLYSLLPAGLAAQRVAIHGFGSPGMAGPGFGLPAAGGIPPLGGFGARMNRGFRRGFNQGMPSYGYGYAGYGMGYDDYGYDSGASYQAAPTIILVTAPPQEPPPPPPEPPKLEIREYNNPDTGVQGAAAQFSIVTTDGATRTAVAVWVQQNAVHFITPEGGGGQIPLSSVDREATRRANEAKQLMLPLPAPSEPAAKPGPRPR